MSELNEVSSDKFSQFNTDIPIGFESDLHVIGIAYPEEGQVFRVMSEGQVLFETTGRGVRFELNVPSSNKNITWGAYGNKVNTQVFNILPTSGTLNEVVINASMLNSYLRITGNHRSWAGFLFWR